MTQPVTFAVTGNKPRVLTQGEPLPPDLDAAGAPLTGSPPEAGTPAPFWTGDKVATMVGKGLESLSKAFGDESLKAEAWELELVEASPAASLLQDLLPGTANSGEGLSTVAKVAMVALVIGLLVLLRLPTILTVIRQQQLAAYQAQAPAADGGVPEPGPAPGASDGQLSKAQQIFQADSVGSGRLGGG